MSLSMISFKRESAQEIGAEGRSYLTTWTVFHLLSSNFALPILAATFLFSKSAKRHPTLINMCIAWILSGVFSVLLFYAGEQTGPEPNERLCIAQSSLLNGTPPMWSVAVLCLVYYMQSTLSGDPRPWSKVKIYSILAAPYVTLTVWCIAAAILGTQEPSKVNRARRYFYCSLHNSPFTNSMSIFVAAVCMVGLGLEVHLAMLVSRNWRALRKAGRSSGVDLQLVFRMFIFEFYILVGMLLDLSTIFTNSTAAPDIFASSIGLAVALVFGLQSDVLRAFVFWRAPPPPPAPCGYLSREPSYLPTLDMCQSIEDDPEKVINIGRKGMDAEP